MGLGGSCFRESFIEVKSNTPVIGYIGAESGGRLSWGYEFSELNELLLLNPLEPPNTALDKGERVLGSPHVTLLYPSKASTPKKVDGAGGLAEERGENCCISLLSDNFLLMDACGGVNTESNGGDMREP